MYRVIQYDNFVLNKLIYKITDTKKIENKRERERDLG